jgi:DNA-binding MarR family transcriptional regulator
MKCVAETLGMEINTKRWIGADNLPYYLADRYEFKEAVFDGIHCLLMKPRGELDTLSAIKKHITRVREAEILPVVLELDDIVARRRKSLIEARIPFVAPECHIYLPFLGIALSERYTSVVEQSELLMPSSQLLLFYYLYKGEHELRTGETTNMLNFSAMQISRAIKQLVALELVTAHKDGVRIIVSSSEDHCDLFERAKPHLLNPVRKRIYVEHRELPAGQPLAGYSALSDLTMLGGSVTETYAFFGKIGQLHGTDTLVDNTMQAEVEIWRYDPSILSKQPGVVDALSLVASLLPVDDPRVEQSIDVLLKTVWG